VSFIVLLASVALMQYILTRPEERRSKTPDAIAEAARNPEESCPVATPGLLALGSALDSFGRGRAPQAEPVAVKGREGVDG
jgi:hypothetical protein